jgi:hypothetical protein
MEQEQRGTLNPLPDDVYKQLNANQLHALKLANKYGWNLEFVRRSLNIDPTFVVCYGKNQRHAILGEDGSLNLESGIKIRKESPV